MTLSRHDTISSYAESLLAHEPEVWRVRRKFGETLRPGLQMSAHEAALCAWLLRLHGAKTVIEIGSFIGVSALWLARGLPEDGRVITIERDATYAAHTRDTLRITGENRVELIETDALSALSACPLGKACAVFIDGEKRAYPALLEASLPHLRAGALILADNTLLGGALLDASSPKRASDSARAAMHRFHSLLADRARFDAILLPTHEGLSAAVYRG
jgi:predicted O-methyltransferase YrrM